MKDARLQLRVPSTLKKQAEQIARQRNTTLSAMVTQYLQNLVEADKIEQMTGAHREVEQI